jgi:hypothetical protein
MAAAVVLVVGCGKKDESLAKKAGGKVGEVLTDFAAGVGKGVDKQMLVNVELTPAVTQAGITKTVAKSLAMGASTNGFTVYLVAGRALKGQLVAKALNKEDQEVGRAVVAVEFAAEDAKYVTFVFSREMDSLLVAKYVVDVRQ